MTSRQQRHSLEEAIVDTVREPPIVLDDAVRVVAASRSFYRDAAGNQGPSPLRIGSRPMGHPARWELLTAVIPQHATIEDF